MEAVINIISGMTSREKAYFRKSAETHARAKHKNYLQLYEAIVKNPQWSAAEVRQHFQGTRLQGHFSSEMNYLFEQLMKALLNFHLNAGNSYKLLKLIFYIEILLEKGQRQKAAQLLRKAKASAYQFEDFALVIKTIELEERVLFKQGILTYLSKLESLEKERQLATDKINNLNQMRLLREQVREFQFTHIFVNYPENYPEVFAHPLLEDPQKMLSVQALEIWYYLKCIIGYLTRNFSEGIVASRRYLSFLEERLTFFSDAKLLPALSNYLLMLSMLGEEQEFLEVSKKLDLLEQQGTVDTHYIKYIRYCRFFELAYQNHHLEMADEILSKTSVLLTEENEFLAEAQKDYLFYYAIRCCIDRRKFEQGFELMSFWYQLGVEEFSTSLRRIFKLIIIYELGYFKMLEAEVQTAYKILQKRKKYERLEKTFIAFFRKIAANPTREKMLLNKLETDLQDIGQNKDENKYFDYIDYHRWCNDRIVRLGIGPETVF